LKISQRLKEYITSKGIKYSTVAKNAGISQKRFYRVINGDCHLTADEFEKICKDGLSVEPAFFLEKTSH
jgi:transcriptional regulator with XRE-family HTH domain